MGFDDVCSQPVRPPLVSVFLPGRVGMESNTLHISRLRIVRRCTLPVLGFIWVMLIALGMFMLWKYQNTPGTRGDTPERWPIDSQIQLTTGRPTLVLVAHPHCSCTRASIGELSRLMTRLQGRLAAHVIFQIPEGRDLDWAKTDLWFNASRISGVQVLADRGGVEAARFGAGTSGYTLLYGTDGSLLFHGGITPSRSHFGNSVGRERIISLVLKGGADRGTSAVFGCPLSSGESENFYLPQLRFLDNGDPANNSPGDEP